MAQQILGTNTFTVAKWVVSATASDGTHTTIASAITSASSGDVIYIRDGTYTENLTAKAGVKLVGESLSSTIIVGKISANITGTFDVYSCYLQTNGDNIVAISGSNAMGVRFYNCFLYCSNATGISAANSNAASAVECENCIGQIDNGATLFAVSNANGLYLLNTSLSGFNLLGGASSTASTISAGALRARYCVFSNPITTSGTAEYNLFHCTIDVANKNVTVLTAGGSGTHLSNFNLYRSGSASAISIGGTLNSYHDTVDSTNTNAVTGAGTFNYYGIVFAGSSSTINTTTQTGGFTKGSKSAVTAGYTGEIISSVLSIGSATALTTATAKTVTSISLTAGNWLLTGTVGFFGSTTTQSVTAGISQNNNSYTGTVDAVTSNNGFVNSATINGYAHIIPVNVNLSTTTTWYLIASSAFTVGTNTAWGSILAVRVG